MRRAFTVAGLFLSTLAATLGAQSEPVAIKPPYVRPVVDSAVTDSAVADSVRPTPPNCWRAQPMPPCTGFFLTEIGFETPLVARGRAPDAEAPSSDVRTRFVWAFGFMGTKGRNSHGGVASITLDEATAPLSLALEYRYRRWLTPRHALDFGGGYRSISMWRDTWGFERGHGVTAHAGYTFNPWVGVVLRADMVRGLGRNASALQVGLRSTRVSELAIRVTAILVGRAALAAIGIEPSEEPDGSDGSDG